MSLYQTQPAAARNHAIVEGGFAQDVFLANTLKYGGFVRNPYSATESLYVDPVNKAQIASDGGSNGTTIELKPGDVYPLENSNLPLSAIAETTGHKFVAVAGAKSPNAPQVAAVDVTISNVDVSVQPAIPSTVVSASFTTGGGAAITPYGTSPPSLILNSIVPGDVVLPAFTLPAGATQFRVLSGVYTDASGTIYPSGAVDALFLSGQPTFVNGDGGSANRCTTDGDEFYVATIQMQSNIDNGIQSLETGIQAVYTSSSSMGFFGPLDDTGSFYVILEAQGTFPQPTPAGQEMSLSLVVEYIIPA